MTTQNQTPNIHRASLFMRALQGAALSFSLLGIFLLMMILSGRETFDILFLIPLGTIAIGGACGGVFFYLMDYVRQHGGWKKTVANVLCIPVYFVAMWLSLVFGLAQIGLWH
jgi:hypothetical protein